MAGEPWVGVPGSPNTRSPARDGRFGCGHPGCVTVSVKVPRNVCRPLGGVTRRQFRRGMADGTRAVAPRAARAGGPLSLCIMGLETCRTCLNPRLAFARCGGIGSLSMRSPRQGPLTNNELDQGRRRVTHSAVDGVGRRCRPCDKGLFGQ